VEYLKPERYFTRVGSSLAHKHQPWLEVLVMDKYSSLLQTFMNYNHKKSFLAFGPGEREWREKSKNII
jgi:hypothetical protein